MKKVIVVKANGAKVVKVSARKAVEERELPITETPKSYNEVSVEFMVNYIADHEETAGTWYDALDANIQNNTNKLKKLFCEKFIPEAFAPQKKQYQTMKDKLAVERANRKAQVVEVKPQLEMVSNV